MKLRLLFALAAWLGCNSLIFAHGFRIDIDANRKLQLFSDDPAAAGRLLYEVQAATHIPGVPSFMGDSHPGYDVDTFNGPSGFVGGESIYFEAVGPLWYSDGASAPALAPTGASGVTLTITAQDTVNVPGSVNITGSSAAQSGLLIGTWDGAALGAFEHQLQYNFEQTPTLLTGAYAFELQLTGFDAMNVPFISSDPFVIIFNNGLNVASGQFAAVSSQLYTAIAAVPEPAGLTLILLSGGAAFPFARQWRKQLK